jgi:NAD(P)-dependent dehydrogenase (short-subunit alcohol dehydrogenase family)
MKSLGEGYRALVIGATGAIGSGFVSVLRTDPNCAEVVEVSRAQFPDLSLENEASMIQVSTQIGQRGPFALIVDATGALTIDGNGPEKHLGALDPERLMRSFQVNAIGPVLLLKHFLPRLVSGRAIYAKLSARVGSISDNKKGGWYGYRASKAALNMFLQTAAIEFARKNPSAVIAALQPGTVQSNLTKPFVGQEGILTPYESASGLLQALDVLGLDQVGHQGAFFLDYQGQAIDW